jgi:hypothetical protein
MNTKPALANLNRESKDVGNDKLYKTTANRQEPPPKRARVRALPTRNKRPKPLPPKLFRSQPANST